MSRQRRHCDGRDDGISSNGQFEDERLLGNKRRDEFGDLAASTEKLRLKIYAILDDIRRGSEELPGRP